MARTKKAALGPSYTTFVSIQAAKGMSEFLGTDEVEAA